MDIAYQDLWLRGRRQTPGVRDCESRYDVIRSVVSEYERPVTVWDLGANRGYFGCRLADEFGAVSVMVDPRSILLDACHENAIPTTVALSHRLTAMDLSELAQCEHADVVLCLNLLHHLPDWREALASVLALGEEVLIETPGRGDTRSAHYERSQEILDAVEAMSPQVLAWTPSHVTVDVQRPLFRFSRSKSALTSGYAYRGRVRKQGPHPVRPHVITSTKTTKYVRFSGEDARPWYPGVNLWNWCQLGGVYPERQSVQFRVCEVAATVETHGDFKPWNLILQGQAVKLIDAQHRTSTPDAKGLSETLAWIAQPELAYAQ